MDEVELMQCPVTGKPLRLVRPDELVQLQQRQREGGLCNALGRSVTFPIIDGYVSEAAACYFPKVDGVVWLVAEEAIVVELASH